MVWCAHELLSPLIKFEGHRYGDSSYAWNPESNILEDIHTTSAIPLIERWNYDDAMLEGIILVRCGVLRPVILIHLSTKDINHRLNHEINE